MHMRVFSFCFLLFFSCKQEIHDPYQLVIANASVFNSKTLEVEENRTVFINDGRISKISVSKASDLKEENGIDAKGRLLTPAFIDVHNHLNFVFGDTIVITDPGEFEKARRKFSSQYLPYGVTVVRSAGSREAHISMEQSWMESHPDYVDYYPTGGALVSLDTKFYNHTFVPDDRSVESKIREYHELGFKHVKVYSLMGPKQVRKAVKIANELEMNIFGHIERAIISIGEASDYGLRNFEHAKTLFLDVIREYEVEGRNLSALPPDDNENWRFREYEVFNLLNTKDSSMTKMIERFKENKMSLTPTIHLYAHPIGLTNVELKIPVEPDEQVNWTAEKLGRAEMGYRALSELVSTLHKEGVVLNTGSDTYYPGRSILSEMLLFNEAGIAMDEVLKIATLNSAASIQMDNVYGSIEVGKKAHLVLFEKDPLVSPINLLSKKTVIKDGVVWSMN